MNHGTTILRLSLGLLPLVAFGHGVLAQESARREQIKPAITALVVAPDGKGFLQGSQAGVVYRSFQGNEEQRLDCKLEYVHALRFSAEGALLAIAGGSPAEAGVVELWSWPERKLFRRLEGHDDVVHDAVWLRQSKMLATASADRTLRIWDPANGQCLTTLRGHSGPILALAVSADGKLLCSGSADQTIRVWDTATWKLTRALNNHLGAVHSLAFRLAAPDGPATLASAGDDGTVRIWQPALGRMVRIVYHRTPVYAVTWSRDGARLFTGARDGKVRVVDGESDVLLHEKQLSAARLTNLIGLPDDRILIGNSKGEITPYAPGLASGR